MDLMILENNRELNQNLSIVTAEEKHLEEMVQCHVRAFPGEFMTLLGARFIKNFYKFYVSSKGGIVFVALEPLDKVVGLVAGGMPELRKQFSYSRAPLNVIDIVFIAIANNYVRGRFLHHVRIIVKKVFTKLRHRANVLIRDEPPKDPPGTWSSLLSICTAPDFRGKGIGKALMEAFHKESAIRGYKTMRLSVKADNDVAIALYNKCGWEEILKLPTGVYFKRSIGK